MNVTHVTLKEEDGGEGEGDWREGEEEIRAGVVVFCEGRDRRKLRCKIALVSSKLKWPPTTTGFLDAQSFSENTLHLSFFSQGMHTLDRVRYCCENKNKLFLKEVPAHLGRWMKRSG